MSPKAHTSVNSVAVSKGTAHTTTRAVPEEWPVALTYNGTTQAVMMASPQNLEDFAIGFSLSEQLIAGLDDVKSLEVVDLDDGTECRIWLQDAAAEALTTRRRHMAGPVGCGLCGIDSIEQALRPLAALDAAGPVFGPDQICEAMRALRSKQALHDITRAVHAAGFLAADGSVSHIREDVGRHNALDKLIGALARGGIAADQGAIVLTSRVSLDMVQKTVLAGATVLVAASAPTHHALKLAEASNLTMAALVRDDTFELFTHPSRITPTEATDVA